MSWILKNLHKWYHHEKQMLFENILDHDAIVDVDEIQDLLAEI